MKNNRYQQGCDTLHKLTGDASDKVVKGIESFSPEFGKMMIEFGFGEIYSRPHFNLKEQEIITLTSLISQGAGERQLVFHFKAALHVGLAKEDIVEIIMHCAAYAGFPKAASAMEVLQQVMEGDIVKQEKK